MFVGTIKNTLDPKGRLSVPAHFRNVVSHPDFNGIYVWPALSGEAYLEGAGHERMLRFETALQKMDPFSEPRRVLQDHIFAAAYNLSFDANGRIVLPKNLIEFLGAKDSISFVGVGSGFELWEPGARNQRVEESRAKVKEYHGLLSTAMAPLSGEGL